MYCDNTLEFLMYCNHTHSLQCIVIARESDLNGTVQSKSSLCGNQTIASDAVFCIAVEFQ